MQTLPSSTRQAYLDGVVQRPQVQAALVAEGLGK